MDPIYIILILFLGVVYAVFQDQRKKKDALNHFVLQAGRRLKVEKSSGLWTLMNSIFALVLAALGVHAAMVPESVGGTSLTAYLVVVFSMTVFFVVYIVVERKYQDLYCAGESFYHNGKTIRFSSIKLIEPKGFHSSRITCSTGDVLSVNRSKADLIEAHVKGLKYKK